MLASVVTVAFEGVDARRVDVQVQQLPCGDNPSFTIVGLAELALVMLGFSALTFLVTHPLALQLGTLAYRFGVNLVMYALTGNYKGDQVHVPAILERLGQ